MPELPVIAVIGGSGAEGSGLAVRWAKAGYRVLLGSRGLDRAMARAAELNALLGENRIEGLTNSAAAEGAGIVVLTVPYAAQLPTLRELKPALAGCLLIGVTADIERGGPLSDSELFHLIWGIALGAGTASLAFVIAGIVASFIRNKRYDRRIRGRDPGS